MKSFFKLLLSVFILQLISCNSTTKEEEKLLDEITEKNGEHKILQLPYTSLVNLSDFKATTANWIHVSNVVSDYAIKHDLKFTEGSGIIVNTNDASPNGHLVTKMEHRDIELDIDVLLSKESNSGIFFMGRYELQLLDSWGVKSPKFSDCGGIYERWDETRPKGEQGFDGVAPKVNASKAPGLWQHFTILFRAPKYDANGIKIANAKFEKVTHNGVVIHENVAVSGPAKGTFFEKETDKYAPIIFQGDHGPVAFKNIKYKIFENTLRVTDLTYNYYEGAYNSVIDFKPEEEKKAGKISGFYLDSIVARRNQIGVQFSGKINISTPGEYIFRTLSKNGSRLHIDGKEVVNNDYRHKLRERSNKITLTKGVHNIKVSYYNGKWGNHQLYILAEGPQIHNEELNSYILPHLGESKNSIFVEPTSQTVIQRGFVFYNGAQRMNTISVGDPKHINYTFDSSQGALIQFWKGNFADLTEMWHERGEDQILKPRGEVVQGLEDYGIKILDDPKETPWAEGDEKEFKFNGYKLNKAKEPTFMYSQGQMHIEDYMTHNTNATGLTRTLVIQNRYKNAFLRVASGDFIDLIAENTYSVSGKYFIKINSDSKTHVRKIGEEFELLLPVTNTLKYSIIW